MRSLAARGLFALLLAGAGDALRAEPVEPHGAATPVYPAEFFEPFRPRTALDMLARTPGFSLVEGAEVRGFGGAAGNVLVDGQRPTVKAGGIEEFLRRIPAAHVERIELLRGGEAAQAQGQALVANVILATDARGSGTATIAVSRSFDGKLSPSANASYARSLGQWQVNVEASAELYHLPVKGSYRFYDAGGELVETQTESISGKSPEAAFAASASRLVGGGTLALNGRIGFDRYISSQSLETGAGGASPGRTDIGYRESQHFGELGADWTRPLGQGWSAKLLAIGRTERFRAEEDFAEPGYRGVSNLEQKPLETVGRVTVGREGGRIKPELGVEVAWNALTSRLSYAEDTGSGFTPVDLPGADTRVTELRGEAFANAEFALGQGFGAEAGIAVEASRIRVRGGESNGQTLTYLKPSAAISWSPGEDAEFKIGFRRTVGQLDFGDFAASVDQADGRPLGGNSALRPPQTTRVYLRADYRWAGAGALSAELFHQRHRDLLGFILLPSGEQAHGTIGNAREWGATGLATVPLGSLVPGAQIKFEGTIRRTTAREEQTGRTRRMDDLPAAELEVEFRHDLPRHNLAWGVQYTAAKSAFIYFVDEDYQWRDRPIWSAYIEADAVAGFKAILRADAIGGLKEDRYRWFHQPGPGPQLGHETRTRNEGATVSLTLTRSL